MNLIYAINKLFNYLYSFIKHISEFLTQLAGAIRTSRWSFIFIAIFYFVLKTDQGHDILLGIFSGQTFSEQHFTVIISYALMYSFAVMLWFTPRFTFVKPDILTNLNQTSDPNKKSPKNELNQKAERGFVQRFKNEFVRLAEKQSLSVTKNESSRKSIAPISEDKKSKYRILNKHNFPRFLGSSVFCIAGFALINTKSVNSATLGDIPFYKDPDFLMLLSLVLLLTALYFFDKKKENLEAKDEKHDLKKSAFFFLFLIYLVGLGFLAFISEGRAKFIFLGSGFIVSAFFFAFITVFRSKIWKDQEYLFWLLFFFSGAVVIMFIFLNISDKTPGALYEFPFFYLVFSLLSYLTLITGITNWLKRKKLSYFAFVGIGLWLFCFSKNQHHDVFLTKIKHPNLKESSLTFEKYFDKWISDRIPETRKDSTFPDTIPVILTAVEGGGSRAALWTSAVLSQLDSVTEGDFSKHTFSVTGASGGMIGATHYYAGKKWLQKNKKIEKKVSVKMMKKTFEKDFLSTTLVYTFGRDLFFNYIPETIRGYFDPDDRAKKLEKEWTLALQNALDEKTELSLSDLDKNAALNLTYEELYYAEDFKEPLTDLPVLFFSPASVKSGKQGLISPFKKDENIFSNTIFISDTLRAAGKSLRLVTAAGLNGRFPIINPSGHLDCVKEQFVDAGYYDNNGGIKALEIMEKCQRLIESPEFKAKNIVLDFHVVFISNGNSKPTLDGRESQIFSVPKGALRSLFQRAHHATDHLRIEMGDENFIRIALDHNPEEGEIPILPLARYLSEEATEAIVKQVLANKEINKAKEIFKKSGKIPEAE